mmetsp:Transcript_1858/g.2540  ORF Transcript_1858/g.2540 Transcript_1858/m.2540 type:complete len:400 (-) Transcript_1858:323-1522(-)|eukprot:CAMPEP_0117757754 /NCGR_PEP_ID=MMETSP0947-20121206/14933_1 /TAXON_ID=44440 /ORGANISM="Chattonella subsalsa, Strain CCMP2191" /LENGTH=399 /DNA_ID=CAMNT_0005577735 /DNA_START=48 /DNA_END=1247 /DNA_ORIENTATION=+
MYLFLVVILLVVAPLNGFLTSVQQVKHSAPKMGAFSLKRTKLEMSSQDFDKKVSIGILGASGYTGAELARLLLNHPNAEIKAMTADRMAGQSFADVYPQFSFVKDLPTLTRIEDHEAEDWAGIDVIFCCLPHATTQEIIAKLPERLKVVDLSADFRFFNTDTYKEWYGNDHAAPELQKQAVYGLSELKRDQIKSARLVANPGCYPTAAQLPLIPALKSKVISPENIIIDAKSGTTGAGRAPRQGSLYCEVTEGIHAYGVASHRHAPEIEQELSGAAGTDVIVNFTPHLMPMSRGILETIYVTLENGKTADELKKVLEDAYNDEPFVTILPGNALPQTRHVRGSNHVYINVFQDRLENKAIIISCIDNLVKGASGQALQNMNIMLGFPETAGLELAPMFP